MGYKLLGIFLTPLFPILASYSVIQKRPCLSFPRSFLLPIFKQEKKTASTRSSFKWYGKP